MSKFSIASRLAQFLRKHGDKVVNGSCKLSLTTSALCLLNTLFWDLLDDEGRCIDSTLLPEGCEIVEDIQFLYSFIKKTTTLKLFHGPQTLRGGIDLSHFSNLTVLELRKIPAHLIIGLDLLSERLKALICSRSIYLLKELFVSCMDGTNVVRTWKELRELNISSNYLENLDSSIRSLPNIEILDLSHNHIKNTDEIKMLKHLCFVNLSFNELDHLPVFSTETCRHLTKLFLRNNNLEDLDGLECLFNLEELDIAYNLLSEYYVLKPLEKLKTLNVLNLEGNPLFFHNRHTALVAAYINHSVLNRGLHLNGKLFALPCDMASSPTSYAGPSNFFNHQTSINTVVGNAESTNCVPESNNRISRSPSTLSELDNNSVSSVTSQSGIDQERLFKKKKSKKFRRKSSTIRKGKKQQEAKINEPVVRNHEEFPKCTSETENVPSHIKAKHLLETRRQERGESWLIPDISQRNLSATTPKVPSNTPVVNSLSNQMTNHTDLALKLTTRLATQNSSSPVSDAMDIPSPSSVKEMTEILDIAQEENSDLVPTEKIKCGSRESDDIEILVSDSRDCNAMEHQLSAIKDNLSDYDIYGSPTAAYTDFNQEVELSEEESEDSIFFVEKLEGLKKHSLSLSLKSKYIREKDVVEGKYLENLDLSSLVSVSTVSNEKDGEIQHEIRLEFDSIKTSKQKRVYLMENLESAEVLSKRLQPFVDAKILKEVTVGALECLKCNSQFSKQAAHKILMKTKKPLYGKGLLAVNYDSNKEYLQETNACPNCGNHILVEMESIPLPTVAMPTSVANQLFNSSKKSSEKSPDTLSTGSTSSGSLIANLFSSINLSPILKRKSIPAVQTEQSCDFETSRPTNLANSSNVVEEDSLNNTPELSMRRNSSDITIISNPSQSSILVNPDISIENNLNTIIERDSQASLSPTVSQDHSFSKTSELKVEQHSQLQSQKTCDVNKTESHISTNEEEHDFYSLTESLVDDSNKAVVSNEVFSSGSENYQSPHKTKSFSVKSIDLDESTQLMNSLGEKTIITHQIFCELDHRLKLHLEINVFGKEEEFEAGLQTSIVPLSTGDEFKGLFALSSKKLYIIKLLPLYNLSLQQNEPIEKVIQIIHSCPLSNLRQIKIILGNQGMTLACGAGSHVYTLVIRDADICNSFSSLLSDLIQNPSLEFGKVEFFSSTGETLKRMQSSIFSSRTESDETPEVLSHLFGFWQKVTAGDNDTNHPVCIIITQDDIFISKILYQKQDSCLDLNEICIYHYAEVDHQKISDLISLKLNKDLRNIEISFLNESSENSDSVYWTIKMETKSSLFSLINAVKNPWEEIFKVPLPLTSEEN